MLSFDYDQMYAELNPLTDNKDKHCSVVGQVVGQLLKTMNPGQVRLPTCVLECRSLLESYGDGFGAPQYFVDISKGGYSRSFVCRCDLPSQPIIILNLLVFR